MAISPTNNGAREAILSSIRQNLNASLPFDAVHSEHHGYTKAVSIPILQTIDRHTLVGNFVSSLDLVGGKHTVVRNEAEASVKLIETIGDLDAEKIAVSDSDIVKRLVERAAISTSENASNEFLFGSDLGITSAQWGIAETGTLVLESARESHRLTSLVPPVHVCILKAEDIRQTLGEILELTSKELSPAVTFITGASRTSDIELTLAIGVHGPGELHVIIIDD